MDIPLFDRAPRGRRLGGCVSSSYYIPLLLRPLASDRLTPSSTPTPPAFLPSKRPWLVLPALLPANLLS